MTAGRFVVHCKKDKYDVYIGRFPQDQLQLWGNPFVIGQDGTREQDRKWLLSEKEYKPFNWKFSNRELLNMVPTLKGKVLGCWCGPYVCHGKYSGRVGK